MSRSTEAKVDGATLNTLNHVDSNNSNKKTAINGTQINNKNGSNGTHNNIKNTSTQNGTSNPNIFANREYKPKMRIPGTIPMRRQDLVHAVGWGYKDTVLRLRDGKCTVNTDRYGFRQTTGSDDFIHYFRETFGVDPYEKNLFQDCELPSMPEPTIKKEFVAELEKIKLPYSIDGEDRRYRSHGQKPIEIFSLRTGRQFSRYIDLVVWPNCHEDVVRLVELANVHNVVLVPFGGGTCVSKALLLDLEEKRMIVSLDTSQMDQMLWLDKTNMLACFQAGIVGQDVDKELAKYGFISGHEPDSNEFSSLGGWIATRASGMKKNKYGNIEDIVSDIRFVTSKGTLEKNNQAQRISCGPDFDNVILGSEGTLGVITEATIKIRPLAEVTDYNSYVFPDFSCGIKFMQEVAKKQWQPAALRLMDNEQYMFGKLLKEPVEGYIANFVENLKMYYLSRIRGIQEDKMAVVVVVFEGTYDEVKEQQSNIASVAVHYGGVQAGYSNGKRGYLLTYLVSYLREELLTLWIIGDTLETSVSWDRCEFLINNVKQEVRKKAKELDIKNCVVTARISQVYDTGACVYFYILYCFKNGPDPGEYYPKLEETALETILSSGGSLSHHHGIGKSRRALYPVQCSDMAVDVFKTIKKQLDPKDIFAIGNIVPK